MMPEVNTTLESVTWATEEPTGQNPPEPEPVTPGDAAKLLADANAVFWVDLGKFHVVSKHPIVELLIYLSSASEPPKTFTIPDTVAALSQGAFTGCPEDHRVVTRAYRSTFGHF
jgi:hypothetical protein